MSEFKDKSRQPDTGGDVPVEEMQHPETMYDRSDLSARAIVLFLVSLGITLVLIHIITWGFLRYFSGNRLTPVPRNAAVVTPSLQMGPKGDPVRRFPAPQLQPDPVGDLNKFQATVDERLNSSGWVDQKNGVSHIPVEQAIDMVSKSGLPVRQPPALPPRARFGSGDGTPAGSGGGTEPKGNQ